ncbi:hypothetical protein H2248_003688 [Termitomyces sp. 'cryptogamus']|nr:hypothetical protein H2248_003688 [Termitomyces sp. 'cryptogamus']
MPTMLTTDTTYPHIHPAKLNVHWPTSMPPFDQTMGKFTKWSNKLKIFLQQSRLDHYIFVPKNKPSQLITEPSQSAKPVTHAKWLANNDLIVGIICAAISEAEKEGLLTDGSAKECYNNLKARVQSEGPVKQVALICKTLTTYAPISEPLETTAWKICDLVN